MPRHFGSCILASLPSACYAGSQDKRRAVGLNADLSFGYLVPAFSVGTVKKRSARRTSSPTRLVPECFLGAGREESDGQLSASWNEIAKNTDDATTVLDHPFHDARGLLKHLTGSREH